MSFVADYAGAVVVEAANYGYGVPNRPKTVCFHCPEEVADDDPQTPGYLAGTTREASYTYFVSSGLALVFQLVPEGEGAYANCLNGKPEPAWSDGTNLNLQTLSVSFEGMAATIHLTMPRGCPQWRAGVALVADRAKALGLNIDWAIQHKDVSRQRSDCGQFDQTAFIADVRAKMEGKMSELTNALNRILTGKEIGGVDGEDALLRRQLTQLFEKNARASRNGKGVLSALRMHLENHPSGGGATLADVKAEINKAKVIATD